jgi:DNA-binding transcriptional LysR family regulator
MALVETRRLELLLQLSRLGSMRAVADELHITTSTVSQQLAALAAEVGTALTEPDGRRVRLTPAGRRLAEHAVTVLAAVEAARLDLDPAAEPAGTLRVAGFATAVRRSLLPIMAGLATSHPRLRLLVAEHEPFESFALLAADDVDLALTYDYNLAPAPVERTLRATPLWSVEWALAVPATTGGVPGDAGGAGDARAVFGRFRGYDWIVNSRNTADEDVVRTLAAMAGFEPAVAHRADSLDLVQDMIVAGLGVALLPADLPPPPGVRLLPLADPEVSLRSYAVIRRGRATWPPLALVLDVLSRGPSPTGPSRAPSPG